MASAQQDIQFVSAGNQPSGTTAAYYEASRTIQQGSTTVLTRTTCYNETGSPCTSSTFSLPITQYDTYETLDEIETHGIEATYNTYGVSTEIDTYDFGGGSGREAQFY